MYLASNTKHGGMFNGEEKLSTSRGLEGSFSVDAHVDNKLYGAQQAIEEWVNLCVPRNVHARVSRWHGWDW